MRKPQEIKFLGNKKISEYSFSYFFNGIEELYHPQGMSIACIMNQFIIIRMNSQPFKPTKKCMRAKKREIYCNKVM